MDIIIQTVEVSNESVNPGLKIKADIEYVTNLTVPISISGTIKIHGGNTVGSLYEFQINSDNKINLYVYKSQEEMNASIHNGKKSTYYAYFIAELSNAAIDYIEGMREKNKEKDVNLVFDFFVKWFEIPAVPDPQSGKFQTQNFLQLNTKSFSRNYTVKHSDWISKFAPKLGLGNFLLLDLKIPDQHTVEKFWVELYDALVSNLKDMESSIRSGDWTKTLFHARKLFENLKIGDGKPEHKKFEEELKKLFEMDQHDDEGFQNFLDGIWKFFEFISKFVHDKNKKGEIKPRPIPAKEDAYFAYALGIGLLNIMGKKTSKE